MYLVQGGTPPQTRYTPWDQVHTPGTRYVPGPGGCTWYWGVYLVLGSVPGPGGGCVPGPGGVYLVPGGVPGLGGCTWSGGRWCTWSGTPPPSVDRMTHAYENITLPQTSFAGGNNNQI